MPKNVQTTAQLYSSTHWQRQWQPTPVLLPGKSQGQRSLVGCSPWGREESDTTEQLHFHFSLSRIGEGNGNPLQCSCLENPRDRGAWWLLSMGSHRVGHDWSDLAAAAHTGKVTLKVLQARLQQYTNRELSGVQVGFTNGRGTRDQIANISWVIEKAGEFQKNIYFCFIDYAKAFVWITTNCGKFLKIQEYQITFPAS